jgi:hypothetical protein
LDCSTWEVTFAGPGVVMRGDFPRRDGVGVAVEGLSSGTSGEAGCAGCDGLGVAKRGDLPRLEGVPRREGVPRGEKPLIETMWNIFYLEGCGDPQGQQPSSKVWSRYSIQVFQTPTTTWEPHSASFHRIALKPATKNNCIPFLGSTTRSIPAFSLYDFSNVSQ